MYSNRHIQYTLSYNSRREDHVLFEKIEGIKICNTQHTHTQPFFAALMKKEEIGTECDRGKFGERDCHEDGRRREKMDGGS